MNEDKLTNEFHTALNSDLPLYDYEISTRECSSDRFDGVEYSIESEYVPVDTVLEVIRDNDSIFAEHIGVAKESDGAKLVVFVVEATLDPDGYATLREIENDGRYSTTVD